MSTSPKQIVAFASRFDKDREVIKIYGSPEGLRWLAANLIKLADVDQSSMPDSRLPRTEGEHWHFKPHDSEDERGDLLTESCELVVGRLDSKELGSFEWVLKSIRR